MCNQKAKGRSIENRNQPSDGTYPPVLRDRLARCAERGLTFQKYELA